MNDLTTPVWMAGETVRYGRKRGKVLTFAGKHAIVVVGGGKLRAWPLSEIRKVGW